jgi:hypothetical protein
MTKLSRPAAPAFPTVLRKTSDSRRILRGSRLAPKTIAGTGALAVLFVLAQGCLVPQSVDPITTRPHTVPRVDLTKLPDYMFQPFLTLDPQEQADLAQTPPCQCRLEVSIPAIIADDPTVDVDVRVFVDYDLNVPRSQSPVLTVRLPGSFELTEPTRPLAPLSFDAASLGGPGFHVVELVTGETAGFDKDTVSPPHRAMLQGFESSDFKFAVQVLPPNPAKQSCNDPPVPPAQVKCSP